MALIKNEIPILEYDDENIAVLMPNRNEDYSFPERAVFAFLGHKIDEYADKNNLEIIGQFVSSTKVFDIFKLNYKGEDICLCQAPVGSSASTQLLEFLIACGVKKIISTGSCGTLIEREENKFLIPIKALRAEGTSYHYLPSGRSVEVDEYVINVIKKALSSMGVDYDTCNTWTTDGFFRETPNMVKYRIEEGFSVVEMECSALIACAKFRGVEFGQILFTADSLADITSHDDRDWGVQSYNIALRACLESVIML